MNRYRTSRRHYLATFRLFGGSWILLLYLLSASPLAPVLTTLLAMVDRSHHVAIQHAACGIQVVLRHDCIISPTHRHGIVARALTLVAQRPTQGRPDHVIQFAAGAISEPASAPIIVPVTDPSVLELIPPCNLLQRAARLTAVSAAHTRPPPDTSGFLLSVRSTVLLI